jgi:O-antigen ligase
VTTRWLSTLRNLSLEQFLFVGTLLFLAWIPLPFGSNRLWSESLLNVWAALLLGFCVASAYRRGGFAIGLEKISIPAVLFGSAILWALMQWSSWTPSALHHPIWALAEDTLKIDLPGRITVNPSATLSSVAGLLGYASIFWVAVQLSSRRRVAVTIVKAVAVIAGIYAWYGVLVFLSGNDTILIYQKWEYLSSLTSTFINRNSFATFSGIGLICVLAILLRAVLPVIQSKARVRVRVTQTFEILFRKCSVYLFSGGGLLAALMLSGSRAGIGSTAVGLVALSVLMIRSRRTKATRLAASVIVISGIFGLAALPFSELLTSRLDREDTSLSENSRIEVYRLTLAAIGDAPMTGTGLGTFGDIFPYYRDTDVFTSSAWVKAHNTYLETFLELGAPAALALFSAIGMLAWKCGTNASKFRQRRAIPSVAVAVTVLVGVHSLLDFSMQIPSIAATYSVLLGLGVGVVTHPADVRKELIMPSSAAG